MTRRKPLKFELLENGCLICISHKYSKHIKTGMEYLPYYDDLNRKNTLLHRYIYRKFYGEIPEGLVVRHKCDNSKCCNPLHLELGTREDNNHDRVQRNRSAKGEHHGRAKLTEQKVLEIYNNDKLSVTALARKYNVPHSHIYKIKRKMIWKHLFKEIA